MSTTIQGTMKAVCELSVEENKDLHVLYTELRSKVSGVQLGKLISYDRDSGYAHYTFSGTYSEELTKVLGRAPMPEEIIMLIDSGYSHFGAHCSIDLATRKFYGRVNTD